jgi:serum/glucocorticoid-regulated kinase 2
MGNKQSGKSQGPANPAAAGVLGAIDEDKEMDFEDDLAQLTQLNINGIAQQKLTVNDFELLTVIGKGSFGKVMQVKKRDSGKIYAMKILNKKALVARKQVKHTETERKVLAMIDHPFIVSLRYAFQTPTKLYMVMDFFNGGELFWHLKTEGKFEEYRAKFYAAEIILALEHLHSKDIVYRDLKPENLLLDADGHIKLTDFGLAKESINSTTLTHTFCGTPEYLAPEVLQGTGHGPGVDWWSFGTLLYEMLTGLPPFYNVNLSVMYEKILHAKITYPNHLSASAVSLFNGLLQRDPKMRLGASERDAKEIKSHPFFEDIDWDRMERKEIPPPYVPGVKDEHDISHIDEDFTSERVQDTPATYNPSVMAQAPFDEFTYNPDRQLGQ